MYEIVWDEAAKAELAGLSAFLRRIIVDTVERQLGYEPAVEIRNRKPLRESLPELPPASRELRVRDHHVLYWIPSLRSVAVLRVILKGPASLSEAVGKDEEP